MRDEEKNPFIRRCWWIVVDECGEVQALITGCKKLAHAQRIAESFFPDLPGIRALAWFGQADYKQRHEAVHAYRITPRMCERAEIAPPPNPLPKPPSLDQKAARLQRHFARVAAGGRQ
jgi:hypothetical protein